MATIVEAAREYFRSRRATIRDLGPSLIAVTSPYKGRLYLSHVADRQHGEVVQGILYIYGLGRVPENKWVEMQQVVAAVGGNGIGKADIDQEGDLVLMLDLFASASGFDATVFGAVFEGLLHRTEEVDMLHSAVVHFGLSAIQTLARGTRKRQEGKSRLERELEAILCKANADTCIQGTGPVATGKRNRWSILLISAGPNNIEATRVVRKITGLGLAEAKALVDRIPVELLRGLTKSKATFLVRQLESSGIRAKAVVPGS